MNCPKCGKQMYSKYRDGGSVLICRNCLLNMGHDFEMDNPDWYGNSPKPTMKTKLLLEDADIVMSLLRLKEELWKNRHNLTSNETWLAFKINSCLYSGYPNKLEGRPIFTGD